MQLLPRDQALFFAILIGGVGFFLIGFVDDLVALSPILRLCLQFSVAVAVWCLGVRVDSHYFLSGDSLISGWVSLPVTAIWLVAVVNAFNWIDGLDGLAAGIGGFAAAASLLIYGFVGQPTAALIAMSLLCALCSFLLFNFNPAQVFMGDGGAYFVGFMLASVGVVGSSGLTPLVEISPAALLLPITILAVPICDMVLVILLRIGEGSSPFLADQRHLHHRLLSLGLSHKSTVLVLYSLSCWVNSLVVAAVGVPGGRAAALGSTGVLLFVGLKVRDVMHRTAATR